MRLIDADAAIQEQCSRYCSPREVAECMEHECLCTVGAVLQKAATVDPVVHAHWEMDRESGEPYCSSCGRNCAGLVDERIQTPEGKVIGWALRTPPYCCRCGARMDENEMPKPEMTEEELAMLVDMEEGAGDEDDA